MDAYAAMPDRGYRGVISGLTSEAHEVSRSALCLFCVAISPYKSVSRRREKKERLRRDAALGNTPSEKTELGQIKVWRSQAFTRIFTLCSLCPPCEPCFIFRHANLKVGVPRRSQTFPKKQTHAALKCGVPRVFPT